MHVLRIQNGGKKLQHSLFMSSGSLESECENLGSVHADGEYDSSCR